MVIRWINKFSNESGFIKNIDYKERHFNHTDSYSEAKKFSTTEIAVKTIHKLIEYGEGIQNYFEILE